jgi:hypothetical protein
MSAMFWAKARSSWRTKQKSGLLVRVTQLRGLYTKQKRLLVRVTQLRGVPKYPQFLLGGHVFSHGAAAFSDSSMRDELPARLDRLGSGLIRGLLTSHRLFV